MKTERRERNLVQDNLAMNIRAEVWVRLWNGHLVIILTCAESVSVFSCMQDKMTGWLKQKSGLLQV